MNMLALFLTALAEIVVYCVYAHRWNAWHEHRGIKYRTRERRAGRARSC